MRTELENNQLLKRPANELRPQIRPEVLMARDNNLPVKLFYAIMREARGKGIEILDIGSSEGVDDAEIPLITQVVDEAHEESKRRGWYTEYGSSWGTMDLRLAITNFFTGWGGVNLNPMTEIMVSRGIMDSCNRTIRAFSWKGIIVPDWAPFYVRSQTTINKMPIIDVHIDLNTGNLRLDVLEQVIQERGVNSHELLMYIAHPAVPVGTIMEDDFIENQLIPFCKNKGITLFSDSHISATQFDGQRLRPILSYSGAKDICVEAITVAKEHALPGARAGGIAGNEHVINGIKLLATAEIDIVSSPSQLLAARALLNIQPEKVGERIRVELEQEILPRFDEMKWPVLKPKAGIMMVITVPPGFRQEGIDNPSLLAMITILRRYNVAICPGSVFGPDGKHVLRLILKQKKGEISRALDKMKNEGFDWGAEKPTAEDITFLNEELARLDLTRL